MMTSRNSFQAQPVEAAPQTSPAIAIVIVQREGRPLQLNYTGINLPRIGEQLDLEADGARLFVTVQTVRHPQAGLPVIYATESESLIETLSVVQMGVANVVNRMDAIEAKLEEILAARTQVNGATHRR